MRGARADLKFIPTFPIFLLEMKFNDFFNVSYAWNVYIIIARYK